MLESPCFVSSGCVRVTSFTGTLQQSRISNRHPTPPQNLQPRMATAPAREPWPAGRFLQTLLWYSPLGRMMRPKPISAGTARSVASSEKGSAAAPDPKTMKVLVSGVSGATGSRVVRELLADGCSVRALVRDRERGVAALEKVGVSAADCKDRLEFLVTDLYNLPPAVFEGVSAVISCTGTRVGPPGDTPDRALYLQGIKFFQPKILEDIPENVEYEGIKLLAKGAAAEFISQRESSEGRELVPVLSHEDTAQFRATWGVLDDVVMGGVSQSAVRSDGGNLLFSGSTSVKNSGGFASARTVNFATPLNLSDCSGMHVRVRGDGNRYKFIVRCDERWDGIAHCYSFDTVDGEWVDIDIPWSSFNTVFRADTLPDGEPVNPSRIWALQIMLSKFEYNRELNPSFTPGSFSLRVGTVHGIRESAERKSVETRPYPKFIAVSSAGTTRYFRKDEFEEQLPIVAMSDSLGRLMEWKLSGEDAIRLALRDAGGYVIVRSCALTEKEPVGTGSLLVEQGDNITGQVARDDLARLLVDLLYKPKANTTFEIAEVRDSKPVQNIETAELRVDDPSSRTYTSFPYVPQ